MGSAVAILKQSLLHNKFSEEQKKDVTRTPASGAAAAPPSPIQSADLDKTIFGVLSKSAMTPEEFNTRKNLVLDGLNNFAQKCKELQGLAASQAQNRPSARTSASTRPSKCREYNFWRSSASTRPRQQHPRSISSYKKKDSRISKRKKQSF